MLEETGNHVRTFTISCAGGSYALDSVHIQYNPIWVALSADLLENCGRVRKIIMYIFFWKEIDWNEKTQMLCRRNQWFLPNFDCRPP